MKLLLRKLLMYESGPCVHGVRQGERPTERGMQSLVAVLKPKPKRGRGPDGDEAKQKVIPCSVCGRGDEMMQMFGLRRCADARR